jgi:hypothetical protein
MVGIATPELHLKQVIILCKIPSVPAIGIGDDVGVEVAACENVCAPMSSADTVNVAAGAWMVSAPWF